MSDIKQINLATDQRAERKTLLTVAEWNEYTLTAAEPTDWETNFTDYYTKVGTVYNPVTGTTAPTWAADTYYKAVAERELLGKRTPDSSIEFNPDIETSTDILGYSYTDLNKTEPSQSFDPFTVLGGGKLAAFLNDIRRRNALSELNQFTMYIITAYIGVPGAYEAEKQTGCTITYDSLGGESFVNFPITVHFSNNTVTGTVDKLTKDFVFTEDVAA